MQETKQKSVKKIVVAGDVDHGKSTMLGSILLLSNKVSEEKIASVKAVCIKNGVPFEPAFLFDALKEEQEQGITIDTTRVVFDYEDENFILIDAPGHIEFLKNMATGASEAEQGILVVDGCEGIQTQTRRHVKVLRLLGIKEIVAVVNKQDRIGYSEVAYHQVRQELGTMAKEEGLTLLEVVPIAALHGHNIKENAAEMPWYKGEALLPLLLTIKRRPAIAKAAQPFRMLVQDVYRFAEARYIAGRVISGTISSGTEIMFCPSGKLSTIKSIEIFPEGAVDSAKSGDSVALVLNEQVFVERGEIITLREEPPIVDAELTVQLAWIGATVYDEHATYILKVGTKEVLATVSPGQRAVSKPWATATLPTPQSSATIPSPMTKPKAARSSAALFCAPNMIPSPPARSRPVSPRAYREGPVHQRLCRILRR